MNLLSKLRRLNDFMQKTAGEWVDFDDIANELKEIIDCDVYVISRRGKILAQSSSLVIETEQFQKDDFNKKLNNINEPTKQKGGILPFEADNTAIIPAFGGDNRMGTLILVRLNQDFSEEDFVLGEYGATIVALEIIRSEKERNEKNEEKIIEAKKALEMLSFSELEVVSLMLKKFDDRSEKIIVTSEIADNASISRSVAVNALNKLESAGVLESRSMGMRGTHIKILNEEILNEIKRLKPSNLLNSE